MRGFMTGCLVENSSRADDLDILADEMSADKVRRNGRTRHERLEKGKKKERASPSTP